jgi:hypothetical protein
MKQPNLILSTAVRDPEKQTLLHSYLSIDYLDSSPSEFLALKEGPRVTLAVRNHKEQNRSYRQDLERDFVKILPKISQPSEHSAFGRRGSVLKNF